MRKLNKLSRMEQRAMVRGGLVRDISESDVTV